MHVFVPRLGVATPESRERSDRNKGCSQCIKPQICARVIIGIVTVRPPGRTVPKTAVQWTVWRWYGGRGTHITFDGTGQWTGRPSDGEQSDGTRILAAGGLGIGVHSRGLAGARRALAWHGPCTTRKVWLNL
ncbi:hypothetical protein DFH08DRAFT_822378 [Mycena albidolilacea]|uniref:Uncharacterized protein n=1 Tax=Mycena albidolilacea TaxID=1033008 RepID=A0AAD7ECS7_9AGAR|nr:hypothetical protein DFH08DRAFT_822378 [Mycena albidolilacea]